MTHKLDERRLDELLSTVEVTAEPNHVRRLRTQILVRAHAAERSSLLSLLGFRPAILVATGLLGFILGVSLPQQGFGDSHAAAVLEDQPQGFLTGGDLG